jgi:hypothetical protein
MHTQVSPSCRVSWQVVKCAASWPGMAKIVSRLLPSSSAASPSGQLGRPKKLLTPVSVVLTTVVLYLKRDSVRIGSLHPAIGVIRISAGREARAGPKSFPGLILDQAFVPNSRKGLGKTEPTSARADFLVELGGFELMVIGRRCSSDRNGRGNRSCLRRRANLPFPRGFAVRCGKSARRAAAEKPTNARGRDPRSLSHSSASARTVACDAARAVQTALQCAGEIATLILPAETAWLEADRPALALPLPMRRLPPPRRLSGPPARSDRAGKP